MSEWRISLASSILRNVTFLKNQNAKRGQQATGTKSGRERERETERDRQRETERKRQRQRERVIQLLN